MRRRRYQDARLQAIYDDTVALWRSGLRGRKPDQPIVHGLWYPDGRPFRGASGHSYFWNGYRGLTLKALGPGKPRRPMGVPGSTGRVSYMAGRDCAEIAKRCEIPTCKDGSGFWLCVECGRRVCGHHCGNKENVDLLREQDRDHGRAVCGSCRIGGTE